MNKTSLMVLALVLGCCLCANAQDKTAQPSATAVSETNSTSKADATTVASDQQTKSATAPAATQVDEATHTPTNAKQIERTPEMLERKKQGPKLDQPN